MTPQSGPDVPFGWDTRLTSIEFETTISCNQAIAGSANLTPITASDPTAQEVLRKDS